MDKTVLFNIGDIKNELIATTLKDVFESLKARGYDPVNQMVGYLISGDPGYISSYNNARNKIIELDRSEIVQTLLESFLNK